MLYAKQGGQFFQAQAPCAEDFDNVQEAHEFGLAPQHVGKYAWALAGGLGSNLVRGLLSELPNQNAAAGKLIDRKFLISHLADPHEMIFIHPYKNFTRLRAVYRAIYHSGTGCSQVPGLQAIRRMGPRRQDATAHPPTPVASPPPSPPLLHHLTLITTTSGLPCQLHVSEQDASTNLNWILVVQESASISAPSDLAV